VKVSGTSARRGTVRREGDQIWPAGEEGRRIGWRGCIGKGGGPERPLQGPLLGFDFAISRFPAVRSERIRFSGRLVSDGSGLRLTVARPHNPPSPHPEIPLTPRSGSGAARGGGGAERGSK